jgi:very-short-patch-repair endonuclease
MNHARTALVKELRKNSTDAERYLWKHLRMKQLEGLKFRRQEPIGKYIVDFVCFEKAVVIEVDGGQHSEERDSDRDAWLVSQGFKVVRFWNHDVLTNVEGVLAMILKNCFQESPSQPLDASHRTGQATLLPPIKGGATTGKAGL